MVLGVYGKESDRDLHGWVCSGERSFRLGGKRMGVGPILDNESQNLVTKISRCHGGEHTPHSSRVVHSNAIHVFLRIDEKLPLRQS